MDRSIPDVPIVLRESASYLSRDFKLWARFALGGGLVLLAPTLILIAQSVALALPLSNLAIQIFAFLFIGPTILVAAGIVITIVQVNRDSRSAVFQIAPIGVVLTSLGSLVLIFALMQFTKSEVFDVLVISPLLAICCLLVALLIAIVIYVFLVKARKSVIAANLRAAEAQRQLQSDQRAKQEIQELHELATRMILAWQSYLRDGGEVWVVDAVKKNGPQVTVNARRVGEGQHANKNKSVWPNGFDIRAGNAVILSSNNTVLYLWDSDDQDVLEEAARTGWEMPEVEPESD